MRIIKLSELIQDAGNLNRGTDAGRELVSESIGKLGAGRSVLVDRQGRIIAGNKTVSGAIQAGLTEALIIETNGEQVVVVKRTDLDLESDLKARELSFADNRASEVGLEWDAEEMANFLDSVDNPLDIVGVDMELLNSFTLEDAPIPEPNDEGYEPSEPSEEKEDFSQYNGETKDRGEYLMFTFDDVEVLNKLREFFEIKPSMRVVDGQKLVAALGMEND